ncbi:hypothetical protein Noda2021_11900 [Candidatus Dependentiae bacterium Noda2021]|nr:hypothetical protein Noda2021_11900 [Candidatus Dependentiae bacterium Noda2021]
MKKNIMAFAAVVTGLFAVSCVDAAVRRLNDINFGYVHRVVNNTRQPITATVRLIGWHTQYGKEAIQPGETGVFQTGGWVPSDIIINVPSTNREAQADLGQAKEWNVFVSEDPSTGRLIIDRR